MGYGALNGALFHAVFWMMLPLIGVQGLWVRRRAVRLPGAEGERSGAVGEGNEIHLLAIGDSIIDGVGTEHIRDALPVRFAAALSETSGRRVNWRVEAESGLNLLDVLERLDTLKMPRAPDLVLISVGVNDVTGLSSVRAWRQGMVELLEALCRRWPQARVIFLGLPPMALFPLPPQPLRFTLGLRAAILDRIAADLLSACPNAVHAPTRINPREHDFCEDGFHPSAKSCNLWAWELAAIESRSESI